MSKQKLVLFCICIGLMAAVGVTLQQFQSRQRLGQPGVKTRPIPDSQNLEVVLPERVLDYTSELIPLEAIVTNTLPKDTSFGQRRYSAPDGFTVQLNVVLMGGDRTSLHKPQFCLNGAGWGIDASASSDAKIQVEEPCHYELPVVKLIANKAGARGVYVYYYVADDAVSAGTLGYERMWWMARDLIRTGILQRWAYVSYFAVCPPGAEDATFERMKKLIAASAPEFQLTPRAAASLSAK